MAAHYLVPSIFLIGFRIPVGHTVCHKIADGIDRAPSSSTEPPDVRGKVTDHKLVLDFVDGSLFPLGGFVRNRKEFVQDFPDLIILNLQKIPEDWIVEGDVSDTMAAYISYPQDRSDHTFSVYVNRPGLSFGYFFRGGGSLSGVERGIAEFTADGYNERAFISMNQPKAARLEIDDGNTVQIIDLNSDQPFAIVLPANAGVIHFYDGNGNPVKYQKNPL